MTLDRLIVFGVGIVVASLAVPHVVPGLLDGRTTAVDGSASNATENPTTENSKKPQPVPGYGHQVVLNADRAGHYVADATINGVSVRVMLDTGATIVALTAETARRLGIDPSRSSVRIGMSTANGTVSAALVTLGHVRLGNVDVYNVQAAVLPPDALSINLLGMSFLGKLSRFQAGGGQLVLVQ